MHTAPRCPSVEVHLEGGFAMDGWDWLWMTFAMVIRLVVIGVVVYFAVRLATRPPRATRQ